MKKSVIAMMIVCGLAPAISQAECNSTQLVANLKLIQTDVHSQASDNAIYACNNRKSLVADVIRRAECLGGLSKQERAVEIIVDMKTTCDERANGALQVVPQKEAPSYAAPSNVEAKGAK